MVGSTVRVQARSWTPVSLFTAMEIHAMSDMFGSSEFSLSPRRDEDDLDAEPVDAEAEDDEDLEDDLEFDDEFDDLDDDDDDEDDDDDLDEDEDDDLDDEDDLDDDLDDLDDLADEEEE
jgi:hypothetical protein